jgi:hypothetical protein
LRLCLHLCLLFHHLCFFLLQLELEDGLLACDRFDLALRVFQLLVEVPHLLLLLLLLTIDLLLLPLPLQGGLFLLLALTRGFFLKQAQTGRLPLLLVRRR